MRTSFQKNKKIFFFLLIILGFGILSGIFLYLKQEESLKTTILLNMGEVFNHNVFDLKNIFLHLGIVLTIIAGAFLFLGIPILIATIFFEGITIGFILPIFLSLFKWKFLYTFSLYLLFTKGIYLILLSFLFIKVLHFSKEYIAYIKKRKASFLSSLKKLFLLLIILFINDIITYFIGNKLLILLLGRSM